MQTLPRSEPAVSFLDVSKRYQLGSWRPGPLHRLRQVISRTQLGQSHFWALKDVTFSARPGEVLGIIGPNGAGKSTILKILAGVTKPTTGKVQVNGRLSALIELGAGFHPELTGRENIFLNGAILGLKRPEISRLFDDIVEFAELKEFIDMPVKHYSSGMYARLGFSIAAHIDPEVLLVDEVLAVGDAAFQRRCYEKIYSMVNHHGRAVVMVSHGFGHIRRLCSQVVWLQRGEVQQIGTPDEVIRAYEGSVFGRAANVIASMSDNEKPVRIVNVELFNGKGEDSINFTPLDSLTARITYQANPEFSDLAFAVGVMRQDTLNCYTSYSSDMDFAIPNRETGGVLEASYSQLHLLPGDYALYATALSALDKGQIYTFRTIWFRVDSDEVLDIRNGSFHNPPFWRLVR